nr:hypothetical protein CKG001_12180 [Bdellovibrio sp. CKG001]BFD62489.1 hypothetical protein BdHM001_11700 [Bdellovibrio sp. HM001]
MRKVAWIVIPLTWLSFSGCGLKVINPNDQNPNKDTLALDMSSGRPELVATYTCKVQSQGSRFFGLGKTEEEARKDALGKCRSRTLLSFCDEQKVTCEKN